MDDDEYALCTSITKTTGTAATYNLVKTFWAIHENIATNRKVVFALTETNRIETH